MIIKRFLRVALALAVPLVASLLILILLGRGTEARNRTNAKPYGSLFTVSRSVYVDVSNTDLEDGSRDHPWNTIAEGLGVAQPGDTILVAQGTYPENITIDKNVVLAGGYASYTSPISWTQDITAYVTIIDGRGSGSVATITNGAAATISGFTITNGQASLGGGIHIDGSPVVLYDNTIAGNHAVGPSPNGNGGGIYITGASATVSNTYVLSNTASQWGGGIYLVASSAQVSNVTVADNTALWEGGGGVYMEDSSATISDSRIMSNTAYCCGGGIGVDDSSAILDGNQIINNSVDPTSYFGGGIYANHASVTINANEILGNHARAGGGITAGDFGYTMTNNLVAQNLGGGILVQTGQIANNTIRDNVANDYGEYGEGILISPLAYPTLVTITNNIIISNVYGIRTLGAGVTTTLSYNDVWGNSTANYAGVAPGRNDIFVDPLILAMTGDGYRLPPYSPCIDAGTNEGAPAADFEDDPRPYDGDGDGIAVVDIGADEYVEDTIPTPTTTPTVTPTTIRICIPFTAKNYPPCAGYIENGGFESGPPALPWVQYSSGGFELISDSKPHSGKWGAFLAGYNQATEELYQLVTIPTHDKAVPLTYYWTMVTEETSETGDDFLYVSVRDSSGRLLCNLEIISNASQADQWVYSVFDVQEFVGQTVRIVFSTMTDEAALTSFFIDDVRLLVCESSAPVPTGTPTPTASVP